MYPAPREGGTVAAGEGYYVRSCFLYRAGRKFVLLCASLLTTGCCLNCSTALPPAEGEPPENVIFYGYEVVNTYPHDPKAFTQGLVYSGGFLYEGTGLNGSSTIRKVALETGEVLQRADLARAYFGEGIAVEGKRLVQLTWKSQVGFIYNLDSFEKAGDFSYLGEGWGLTHDGARFIMSDGSTKLRFLGGNNFQQTGQVYVRYGDSPVKNINELEFVEGTVYANVWREDRIAMIDPASGYVTGWLDLSGLLTDEESKQADVLNGIAWDAAGKRLFVTGKLWPKLFEIRLVEQRRVPYPAR